jgi:hypothetical protein
VFAHEDVTTHLNRADDMRTKAFLAVAALLLAGACAKKDTAATDTAGTAAMTDTTTGAAGAMPGSPGTAPSPTMSDTAATGSMGTATGTDTTKGRTSGDTTTKK